MTRELKHELWQERICDYRNSGLNAQAWCQQNKLTLSSLHYWINKLADLADFPVVRIEHKLSAEECVCHCGKALKVITEKKPVICVLCRLTLNEKSMWYPSMGVKTVAVGIILRAKKEPSLLRGSIATPSIVAAIMNGKYVNSVPLARHESEFQLL